MPSQFLHLCHTAVALISKPRRSGTPYYIQSSSTAETVSFKT